MALALGFCSAAGCVTREVVSVPTIPPATTAAPAERIGPPTGLLAPWTLPPLPDPASIKGRPPLDVALEALGQGVGALGFKKDFRPADSYRLEVVNRALAEPLGVLKLLDDASPALDPTFRIRWAASMLGKPLDAIIPVETKGPIVSIGGDQLLAAAPEDSPWRRHPEFVNTLAAMLSTFLVDVSRGSALARAALETLPPPDRERIVKAARRFPIDMNEDEAKELYALLERVDVKQMLEAAVVLSEAASSLADSLESTRMPWAGEKRPAKKAGPPAPGSKRRVKAQAADDEDEFWPPLIVETELGRVIVGGPDDDVHRGPALAIVDLGGDDTYLGVEPSPQASALVTVDMGGNDLYRAEDAGGAGTGILAASVSFDLSGDDTYISAGPGPAAAVGGAGVLIDLAGNDRYVTDRMGEGAAVAGLGMLIDAAGQDLYTASTFSQGMGGPGGVGLLVDAGGNDVYASQSGQADDREATNAFESFSQGYAMGYREVVSGGVGWLEDLGGDDAYVASYFAQGGAYWYGLGVLLDRSGNDRYHARRYAQGAGVHAAVGVLDDRRGNDSYESWGVSQGCGHDLSVGILRDSAGDDSYHGSWMVQGAGNDNGVGMLLDVSGDDTYEADGAQSQGWASQSRGAVGFGLLLDGGGKDRFHGPATPPIWVHDFYGVGVDGDGPVP